MAIPLLWVALFLASPSLSQRLRFDHISTRQGLSQDIVNTIVQDGEGFIWFGTEDGLNRYDGYSVRTYKHDANDSTTISGDWITVLAVDREGRLWVGTGNGPDLYDPLTDGFIRIHPSSISYRAGGGFWVSGIGQDSAGRIWVCQPSGLFQYNDRTGSLDAWHSTGGVTEGYGCFFTDRRGTIWLGTVYGLCTVDPAEGTVSLHFPEGERKGVLASSVAAIEEDARQNLWVGTRDSGMFVLDSARTKIRRYRRGGGAAGGLSSDIVFSVRTDGHGDVWIGTFLGLDRFVSAAGSFTHIMPDAADPASLSGVRIYSVYHDRAGTLWLGIYRGGVNHYDPLKQRFQLYGHGTGARETPGTEAMYALLEDREGTVWAGTGEGLERFDRQSGAFQLVLGTGMDPRRGAVTAIREKADGRLWVGTETGDLLLVEKTGSVQRRLPGGFDYPSRAGRRAIRALYEGTDGTLWIGMAEAGLLRLDARRWKVDADPLAGTGVTYGLGVWCIHEDRRGDLWFGGWGGSNALVRYSPRTGTARSYRPESSRGGSISSPHVRAIYEDSAGTLWFGTWGGGLNRFDPDSGTFTAITEREGLSNNYVKGILAEAGGGLWISTERGITRYDPRAPAFRRYTTEDGLQGDRFLSGSCCLGRDGWMYFGGENGLNAFHPDSIRRNVYIPPVVITSFRVVDRPSRFEISPDGQRAVHLNYDQDFFSFEFVALNFTQPEHNEYAYMMEGFDPDWVYSGTRRYAAYTHLDGGTYTFLVKAGNNDGIWNEHPASVLVVIRPPFWKTPWFYALAAVTIILALYLGVRFRVRRLVEVERLRTRIATDLHDDIGANLTRITVYADAVRRQLDAGGKPTEGSSVEELIAEIRTTSRELVDSMSDVVWSVDPRNDSFESLLMRMKAVTGRVLEAKGIEYEIEIPGDIAALKLPLDFRRNFFLVFKEALNNVLRHSGAGAVRIRVAREGGFLLLSVADDGCGFEDASEGNGLRNMRRRGKMMNGDLQIESSRGKGTTVRLSAKLP